jgi:non-ribosomal peptide synthetase component E (peptide arylation enzyme)
MVRFLSRALVSRQAIIKMKKPKEAFDDNGFFKTGDIGEITSDGFLKN